MLGKTSSFATIVDSMLDVEVGLDQQLGVSLQRNSVHCDLLACLVSNGYTLWRSVWKFSSVSLIWGQPSRIFFDYELLSFLVSGMHRAF